jgi:hypothetical protein
LNTTGRTHAQKNSKASDRQVEAVDFLDPVENHIGNMLYYQVILHCYSVFQWRLCSVTPLGICHHCVEKNRNYLMTSPSLLFFIKKGASMLFASNLNKDNERKTYEL